MTLDEYRKWACGLVAYANPGELILGLVEEAGELAGKFKRLERGDYDRVDPETQHEFLDPKFRDLVANEGGDVLFYLVTLMERYDLKIDDLIAANRAKLLAREAAGTFKGEGDNR